MVAFTAALMLFGFAGQVSGFDMLLFSSSGLHGQAKSALAVAQSWHSDAFLVQIDVANITPNQQRVTYWFRSHSTGEAYMVTDGQGSPAQSNIGGKAIDPSFIEYPAAVKAARDAGVVKSDPGGGVLSYENRDGKQLLIWNLGGARVDAITGKSLTAIDTGYAADYDKMWDAARGSEYSRWKQCADQILPGPYTVHEQRERTGPLDVSPKPS